jgi:hypothetical protein
MESGIEPQVRACAVVAAARPFSYVSWKYRHLAALQQEAVERSQGAI